MHVPLFPSRLSLCLLACFGILISAMGCSTAGTATLPTETPPNSTLPQDRTLLLWHTLDEQQTAALGELAAEFHKSYPDLAIHPIYVGSHDDLTKQMTAAIALGTTPDLVLADRRQLAEFAAQGGLEPLDKWLSDPELGLGKQDREDYWGGSLNLGTYPTLGNRTYGFPFDQEPLVLFYNADLMKGINVNRAPRTWDQFGEYATTVTHDEAYGWAMTANAATFEAMLASRGSALLTDAEARTLLNERAGLASLKLISDLSEGGIAVLAASEDKAQRAFASGNVAFYMGWLSEIAQLEIAQKDAIRTFSIGVAPLPQLDPETPWLLARGDMFGIPAGTGTRARDAWFFVRWITSPTQSARWVRATDSLPMRSSALTFLASTPDSKARFRQILSALEGVEPRFVPQPAHPFMDSIEQAVGDLWLQATQPKPDLRAILDGMAVRINQLLAIKP